MMAALAGAGCAKEQSLADGAKRNGPTLPFDPPTVDGHVDHRQLVGPLVAVAAEAISLDGREIVRLEDGKVPADAVRDDPLGLVIEPLSTALQRWRAPGGERSAREAVILLVAPRVSYRIVFHVILSARHATRDHFRIVVAASDGSLGSLPLLLPAQMTVVPAAPDPPVQLILSVTERRVLLWSISGLEGTLQAPRLELAAAPGRTRSPFDTKRLNGELAALADARWPGGVPPAEQREIIIQANPDIPFQTIVDLMVAVRAHPDGRELFPHILFGRWSFD